MGWGTVVTALGFEALSIAKQVAGHFRSGSEDVKKEDKNKAQINIEELIEMIKMANSQTNEKMEEMMKFCVESRGRSREEIKKELGDTAKEIKRLSDYLGIPKLELDEYELCMASKLIDTSTMVIEWSDIGGLDDIVKNIKQNILEPLSQPAQQLPKGVLFYGPPGCGKTMLAAATAKAAGIRFLDFQVSNIYDKEVGGPQKKTEALFSLAKKIQPTIIFIDEIDSFLSKRSLHDTETTHMVKNLFLSLWDGMASKVSENKIMIMGATNRPGDLDPAIMRRLPITFEVPLPNLENRERIMKKVLKKKNVGDNIEWNKLSHRTEGLSSCELDKLCKEAISNADKETNPGDVTRKLTMQDFEAGLAKIHDFKTNMKMQQRYKTKEEVEKAKKIMKAIGIENIELDTHELRIAAHLLDPSQLSTDWSDIGGLNNVVEDIRKKLLEPLKHSPEALPQGVLFYGPPGCGKTMLAAATAKAAGVRLLNFNVSEMKNTEYGETEKMIAALFSLAKKVQPVVVFIDEIDSILRQRSLQDNETTAALKTQFMTLWDGITTKESKKSDKIIMMGATNRPKDLDQAIVRRLSLKIKIPLPDKVQRLNILKTILNKAKVSDDIDWDSLSCRTEGWNCSDLSELCREASLNGHSRCREGTTEASSRCLQMQDFTEGIQKMDDFRDFKHC